MFYQLIRLELAGRAGTGAAEVVADGIGHFASKCSTLYQLIRLELAGRVGMADMAAIRECIMRASFENAF